MEIRDPIHGSIELTPNETAVVDHPFFQRLRNIKQMGFAEFSFPGATHNRYCHSLGAMHLAGTAFDHILRGFTFKNRQSVWRLRQSVRLASLLHDVGHGPLSHTTEEVMPKVSDLGIKIYESSEKRRANHEDYTIKIVTDSSLSEILKEQFPDIEPKHIALLIDRDLEEDDDFFKESHLNIRPLLSQIVSSELDVDRMDYLARDSYYCGTSYGHVDSDWLIPNLTFYRNKNQLNLAINRRALYTFDDFLLSRFHMYLMVYFHHKSIIYDELLLRYLKSRDCDFILPASLDEYVNYDDYRLHTNLRQSQNRWAKLIADRRPFRMIYESHNQKSVEVQKIAKTLEDNEVDIIQSSSTGRLSRYYTGEPSESEPIFVIDKDLRPSAVANRIEEATEIFDKYREARKIERIYVDPEKYVKAQQILM